LGQNVGRSGGVIARCHDDEHRGGAKQQVVFGHEHSMADEKVGKRTKMQAQALGLALKKVLQLEDVPNTYQVCPKVPRK
jgi:hypothetical protein